MIPLLLLQSLAATMANGDDVPEGTAVTSDGVHWRARWLGGGRLVYLGGLGAPPTDDALRAEEPTRVDGLRGEERATMEWAMTRRAWRLAQFRQRPIPKAAAVRWVAAPAAGEA